MAYFFRNYWLAYDFSTVVGELSQFFVDYHDFAKVMKNLAVFVCIFFLFHLLYRSVDIVLCL